MNRQKATPKMRTVRLLPLSRIVGRGGWGVRAGCYASIFGATDPIDAQQ